MPVERVEFFVEDRSMEAALGGLLPRVLPTIDAQVHSFQGKPDLLKNLPARLRAMASWLPDTWRIVIVLDADRDDCIDLRSRLDRVASDAGLVLRGETSAWQVVNRLAIEELEAWYFGDWTAVCHAYPRVPATVPSQARYRDPDRIRGGTWEALERVLQAAGYFSGGLRKIEAAQEIGRHLDLARNTSASFGKLREVLVELASGAGQSMTGPGQP